MSADALDDLRDQLNAEIEALAEALLGEPNKALSNRRTLRWGGKGSLALEIAGRKRGAWFSHEAGQGGGAIELIRHARSCDMAEAIAWGRQWIGLAAGTPCPPLRHIKAATDAADPEREAKIAEARRIWAEAGPVAGTLGDYYLTKVRRIPAPQNGWPGTVVRYHDSLRSLIVAATRADGTVQAVQRIELTSAGGNKLDANGRKIKRSRGPQDGAMVRLPGDPAGPLLVAEGPETGLSAWRATGHETWVARGSTAKAELPTGRRVVICADDDARRSPADKARRDAVAAWRTAGHNVVLAYPWPIRRADKSDFNDTMQAGGVEAVAARIEAALHPALQAVARVPVDRARAKLADAVGGFVNRALAWTPPEGDEPATPPPVEMIRVDVGAGKSWAARNGLVRLVATLRAAGDQRNVAVLVPTLKLADEQADLLRKMPEAAGLVVREWRGRKADDPDAAGQTMCRDLEAVELAQTLALDPQSTVCRRTLRDGTEAVCQFAAVCGYQRQRQERADIWLGAHELRAFSKPDALGELAAKVIDESSWQAALRDEVAFPLDALDPANLPADDLKIDPLPSLRRLALAALRDHGDGPVTRAAILATGLSEESAIKARRLEWDQIVKLADMPDLVPGMKPAERRAAAAAAAGNRTVRRLVGFWRALGALLADDGPQASGWLSLARGEDGARLVKLKGRHDVPKGWQVPTLVIDAILKPELVTPFYPQARLVADVAVAAPHQRVRQVVDRAYSLAMLEPLDDEEAAAQPEEARRRRNRLRDVWVKIDAEARRVRPGRVLVVAQKAVEAALVAMGLPANVVTAHHNAIAGRDEWRDVAALVVIGRTMPAPDAVAEKAEALMGYAVPRIWPGWYQRTDATRETLAGAELAEADRHPHPLAEAIRWQIAEGELVQIIGRGRGADRTAANPLDVLVMCDVPLPLPVAETVTSESLRPSLPERMLAVGGAVFEAPGDAARAYPKLFTNLEGAKKAFQRDRSGTFPYKGSLIGECPQPLARVAYQVAGPGRRPSVAWIDLQVVPDPEAWLGKRLGLLAWCRVGDDPPPDQPEAVPVPIEAVELVPGSVPGLVPGSLYGRPSMELPPPDRLVIGPRSSPIAMIEAWAMGRCMAAWAAIAPGLKPPDDDVVVVPHPAFVPPSGGPETRARVR